MTEYEQEKQALEKAPNSQEENPPGAKAILSLIDQYSDSDHDEKYVQLFSVGIQWYRRMCLRYRLQVFTYYPLAQLVFSSLSDLPLIHVFYSVYFLLPSEHMLW